MKPSEIIRERAKPSTYIDENGLILSNNVIVQILKYLDEQYEPRKNVCRYIGCQELVNREYFYCDKHLF